MTPEQARRLQSLLYDAKGAPAIILLPPSAAALARPPKKEGHEIPEVVDATRRRMQAQADAHRQALIDLAVEAGITVEWITCTPYDAPTVETLPPATDPDALVQVGVEKVCPTCNGSRFYQGWKCWRCEGKGKYSVARYVRQAT